MKKVLLTQTLLNRQPSEFIFFYPDVENSIANVTPWKVNVDAYEVVSVNKYLFRWKWHRRLEC